MDCEPLVQAMQNGKDWTGYISTLLVPTIIGLIVASIALMQWRTNTLRLKHELFERRYEQFTVVREFLGSIITSGKSKPEEQFKYLVGTTGMRFIFDRKIAEHLEKNIWHLALDLECLEGEIAGIPAGEERSANLKKQSAIKRKLNKELTSLEERFAKYLQLKH